MTGAPFPDGGADPGVPDSDPESAPGQPEGGPGAPGQSTGSGPDPWASDPRASDGSPGTGNFESDVDLAAELAQAAADIDAAEAAAEVTIDLSVATLARERDEYLDALRRLQADFENYKKRVEKQQREHVERAAGELVGKLLPVCDTVDLAIAHGGGEEVKQVWTALFDALEREGLERIDPVGVPFDPTVHDAVAHDPGEGGANGPEVVEVFRTGYRWKGRVLRPAMVKVKG